MQRLQRPHLVLADALRPLEVIWPDLDILQIPPVAREDLRFLMGHRGDLNFTPRDRAEQGVHVGLVQRVGHREPPSISPGRWPRSSAANTGNHNRPPGVDLDAALANEKPKLCPSETYRSNVPCHLSGPQSSPCFSERCSRWPSFLHGPHGLKRNRSKSKPTGSWLPTPFNQAMSLMPLCASSSIDTSMSSQTNPLMSSLCPQSCLSHRQRDSRCVRSFIPNRFASRSRATQPRCSNLNSSSASP